MIELQRLNWLLHAALDGDTAAQAGVTEDEMPTWLSLVNDVTLAKANGQSPMPVNE